MSLHKPAKRDASPSPGQDYQVAKRPRGGLLDKAGESPVKASFGSTIKIGTNDVPTPASQDESATEGPLPAEDDASVVDLTGLDDASDTSSCQAGRAGGCMAGLDVAVDAWAAVAEDSRGTDGPVLEPMDKAQTDIYNAICRGRKSVFITGAAGTGKSVLARNVIAHMRHRYADDPGKVAVLAPTGVAACAIGGSTIHRWASLRTGHRRPEHVDEAVRGISRESGAYSRWREVQVIVLDEISMVDGRLFDLLALIAGRIRKNTKPFGGIQMVISGDFYQLPPVARGRRRSRAATAPGNERAFAFESEMWDIMFSKTSFVLERVYRTVDTWLTNTLNDFRVGKVCTHQAQYMQSMSRVPELPSGAVMTELYGLRAEVDEANQKKLDALEGEAVQFEASDYGDPTLARELSNELLAPQLLVLKVGTPVILLKNINSELVNGSQAVVTGFLAQGCYDALAEHGDKAASVPGVGNSAAEGGDGQHDDDDGEAMAEPRFPVVEFTLDGGQRKQRFHCLPMQFTIESKVAAVTLTATRRQVPLLPAWALSVHKSQGMSLSYVLVDAGRMWEAGQVYVALSRARSYKGLQVRNFGQASVHADPKVVGFYRALQSRAPAGRRRRPRLPTSSQGNILSWLRPADM